MNKSSIGFVVVIVALMVLPMILAAITYAEQVNTIVIKRIEDDQAAFTSLEQGESQGRLFRFGASVIDAVAQSERSYNLITATSGLDDILVNPVPVCSDGTKNVFASQKARFALQFLIPRDLLVTQIYKGYATPTVVPFHPVDPDYPYIMDIALKWEDYINSKGQQYGEQLLQEALQEQGAIKGVDGKWYWVDENGTRTQVVVKFVIRTEDERYDIGNALANILESMGIKVEREYKDFSGALEIVYGSDPAACEWHLYTEGWGFTGLTKYYYGMVVDMYSSITGNAPGWGEEGYWNYQNETIDTIAQKLQNGDYANETEFWSLVKEALQLGIQESMRVFVVWTDDIYVAVSGLHGFITSPKASPWNRYTFMNLEYDDGTQVVLTNRYVYKSGWPWNPVGGFMDFYSRPVYEAVTWPAITSKLTNGEAPYAPAEDAAWTIIGKDNWSVTVDPDTLIYNTTLHRWVTASEEGIVNATVAVEINYKLLNNIKFHDGSTETLADLLSSLYIVLEYSDLSGENDTRYDPILAYFTSDFLSTFVGVKVVNDTTVKVYLNYKSFYDGNILTKADLWTNFPLELYAGMDLLFLQGGYKWTRWGGGTAIHLLNTEQCDQIVALLQNSTVNPPDWVQQLIDLGYLTQSEWENRVNNLINFYNAHHHLLIGNGPFYLDSYDGATDTAVLKRVTNFPIDKNIISQELASAEVSTSLDTQGIANNVSGTVIANLTVELNGNPATSGDVHIYAALLTPDYNVIFLNVEDKGNGEFALVLPKDLPEGDYQLIVYTYPVQYSQPDYQKTLISLVNIPTETSTTSPSGTTSPTGSTTSPSGTTSPEETTTTTTGAPEEGGVSGTVIAAVVVVIIIIAAAYYFMRK